MILGHRLRPIVSRLLLAISLGSLAGCGGGVGDVRAGLVPVTGKVTLDGKPLTTGTISFIAGDGKESYTSQIDGSGSYTLAASPTSPGALPGDYKVIVIAVEAPKMADPMKDVAAGPDMGAPKSLVPEKYKTAETSGLTGTVPKSGGTINFDLKSS